MAWRQFWHAGPNQPEELLKTISKKLENKYSFQSEIIDTYYSTDFGEKISRRSLILTGEIKPGKHIFESEFILKT